MKKILLSLVFLLFFSGCAFHIDYLKKDQDFDISETVEILNKTEKIFCVVYDEKAYIKLDTRHFITFNNFAFDYGDAIKKIGEKFFDQDKNIKFLNVKNITASNDKCDYEISPTLTEVIYTETNRKPYNRELDIAVKFQISDHINEYGFEKEYKSKTISIPWSIASKLVDMSDAITIWTKNRIIDVINEINEKNK